MDYYCLCSRPIAKMLLDIATRNGWVVTDAYNECNLVFTSSKSIFSYLSNELGSNREKVSIESLINILQPRIPFTDFYIKITNKEEGLMIEKLSKNRDNYRLLSLNNNSFKEDFRACYYHDGKWQFGYNIHAKPISLEEGINRLLTETGN